MEYTAIVTVLILLQLFWFAFLVGRQRAKHGIKAPATVGHPEFERAFRAHQNTVEQLVIFLPGMWVYAAGPTRRSARPESRWAWWRRHSS